MMLHDKIEDKENFTDTECSIADFFLEHEKELENLSARDIARQLYISASAVTRFCQKMGYTGYPAFRKDFYTEAEYLHSHFSSINANRPFEKNTADYETAARIGTLYKETVDDTLSLLNYEELEKAARLIANARIIYVVSAGAHGYLAELFLGKMSRIDKTVVFTPNQDIAFNYAASAQKDDCFIIISYNGETPETLKVAKKLTEKNILLSL